MYGVTKAIGRTDWELVIVFGGWIALEMMILSVCLISM
jgi:hypothetical protein